VGRHLGRHASSPQLGGGRIGARLRGFHARGNGDRLPEPGPGAPRLRRLPARAPAQRPGRAPGLRIHLGRGAPLHRLHDVPRRGAVPHLHGRADRTHPAGLHGGGPALARPAARGRADLDARRHLAGPDDPRPGAGGRQDRVRRLPLADGGVAPALRGVGPDAAAGPGDRRL
jgi:hypothetical protein